jgi:hypothetical protein
MNKNDQKNTVIFYEIIINEQLDKSWTEFLPGFDIIYRTDDQAALNGLLNKIWGLNLTVLSVEQRN